MARQLRLRLRLCFLNALVGVGLAACAGFNDPPAEGLAVATPTLPPTPTLLPGLPTSTPQTEGEDSGFAAAAPPTAPPSATPSPTATPRPGERVVLGMAYLEQENFAAAAFELQAAENSGSLEPEQRQVVLNGLGRAYLALDQPTAAADAFNTLLSLTGGVVSVEPGSEAGPGRNASSDGTQDLAEAYYFLGQAYASSGDCRAAIGAYESYLASNAELAAYVRPMMADCYLAEGDRAAAIDALKAAVAGEAHRPIEISIRERLADMYLADLDYAAAAAQYDTILAVATTEATRGWANYQAGTIERLAGDDEAAYARFRIGVESYPRAYESYLGLMALVEAGIEVDDFQRGLVDYHAEVYEPAIAAFNRFVATNPIHREDVHLYLAWCYEGLGNVDAALAEMEAFIAANEPSAEASPTITSTASVPLTPTISATVTVTPGAAPPSTPTPTSIPTGTPATASETDSVGSGDLEAVAKGLIEQAKLEARAERDEAAVDSYLNYLERFPNGEEAPYAAWWAASLSEGLGKLEKAATLYRELAAKYPAHEDADEALFRAGFVSWAAGLEEEAVADWELAAETYPHQEYGAASILWLLKNLPPEESAPFLTLAEEGQGSSYYSLRAKHLAQGVEPFAAPEKLDLTVDGLADQEACADWLGETLGMAEQPSWRLDETLAGDGRLVRGRKLWNLSLRAEAKRELESLRTSYDTDALRSYRLALFFRDVGLYRSSILAAEATMRLTGVNAFTGPACLVRLAYPTYFSDLILAEAEKYGFDPLLQFALVRQESLFESFATSSAVAQGLSQVIPDTGLYIARQLNWPDFENDDLYRPYVGIAFGAFYLHRQLEAFDGNEAVALSAYNGGPGNAARWYGEAHDDLDRYLEVVDFSETRLYIRRIYVGQAIYRFLYGQ